MSYKQQLLVYDICSTYKEIYTFDNEGDLNAFIDHIENETEYTYMNLTKIETNTAKQTIKQAIKRMDINWFKAKYSKGDKK